MTIFENTYTIDFPKEEVYNSFHDVGQWQEGLPYIRKVFLLSSCGVCDTLLISLDFGMKEESVKFFRTSKPQEQIEIELLSSSSLVYFYKGRWLFQAVQNSCLVHVRHVVEIRSAAVSSFRGIQMNRQKEVRTTRRILRKIDRSLLQQITATLAHNNKVLEPFVALDTERIRSCRKVQFMT